MSKIPFRSLKLTFQLDHLEPLKPLYLCGFLGSGSSSRWLSLYILFFITYRHINKEVRFILYHLEPMPEKPVAVRVWSGSR